MFNSSAKMSLEASDVQTDEDCEELGEDGFSLPNDIPEKRRRRKKVTGKPPSQRSPYLSSLNVNPRRATVGAWRLPASPLGDNRDDTPGETSSARLSSILSNGHDCDITPELLKHTLSMRKSKHLLSASNGFAFTTSDYREKEDMYDEIIHLKKNLQVQKSDNRQMKVKVRRLEEENAKREKQIEELLDPTKGSEYTRSFVDKKREGSVVLNGLKQRILKLEQQCREKENALSNLQSDLRITNLEELKITADTYFQEIQRLKILLEAAEKSSRAESKCSLRQQKALSSTVHRLSDNLKQLQQENAVLREELNTDDPAGGIKGYRDWSKHRLLRRLLEVEKRWEGSKRHAQPVKSSSRLDQEVQTTLSESQGFSIATEAGVSVGTMTEEREELVSALMERLSQLEKEKADLQERLSCNNDEIKEIREEKKKLEREVARWKAEQEEQNSRRKQQDLEQLLARVTVLEAEKGKPPEAELSSDPALKTISSAVLEVTEERDAGCKHKEAEGDEDQSPVKDRRAKAALVIQTNWQKHRNKDLVMLQSVLRGHLLREAQLKERLRDAEKKCEDPPTASAGEDLDAEALIMLQSALRGHLSRCGHAIERSEFFVSTSMEHKLPSSSKRGSQSNPKVNRTGNDGDMMDLKEDLGSFSSTHELRVTSTNKAQAKQDCTSESVQTVDSDDSDDIIVSPSRPFRNREVLMA
ncbi:IQ domain-containing protein E isoform X1 [Gouania willdenowi]|uniref:IQ domain-containing protein E n=1 Tax=Gouania willdenowi TaxID=441366 RepID=A0A8C5D7F2_GOUWI|nr:IQ domain-containing protein E isoform X1 [Gouania willdenowi]